MNSANSLFQAVRAVPFWADADGFLARYRGWGGYALALLVILGILALKLLLNPLITVPIPFLLFTSAVLLVAWLGGLGPGLLAITLATALSAFLFVPPQQTFWKQNWGDYLALLIFLLEGAFICRQAHLLNKQHQASRLLNQQLEQRVAERTTELADANAILSRKIEEQRQTEAALRDQEARLQAILASAGAVITIDEQGTIESANRAVETMLGYTPAEVVGKNIAALLPHPYRDEPDGYPADYFRGLVGSLREVQAVRKDGTTFPVELAVTEVRVGAQRLFTGVLRDIQARKSLEREVLEIAAREQHRLGRELHDGVGQQLTGLSLMTDALVHQLAGSAPGPRATAERIAEHLETLHAEVRALSRGLVPVHLDAEGLRAALEDLATRTHQQTRVFCVFRCDDPPPVVDPDAATHLFRIAQEAVSNALRHGLPRTIRISLRNGPGAVVLAIQDDGVGIPNPSAAGRGLGIRIMEYRGGVIGGAVQVRPAAGGGTVVTCTLPRGKKHGGT